MLEKYTFLYQGCVGIIRHGSYETYDNKGVIKAEQRRTKKLEALANEGNERLIQDTKDEIKSAVSQFGKRTDKCSDIHDKNNLKKVVPQDEPLKMAIQSYVGGYEGLWLVIPLLLEPGEFHVEEGQITIPFVFW